MPEIEDLPIPEAVPTEISETMPFGDDDRGGFFGGMTPRGDYDEYMTHIKVLANPVAASVGELLTFATPTPKQLDYIMHLLPLGVHQLTAAAGSWELYLDDLTPRRRSLVKALRDWDAVDEKLYDQLPLTEHECRVELTLIDRQIRTLRKKIQRAKETGHYWSIKPLLEFFAQPQEERVGHAFDHLLPPMLRICVQTIYACMPPGIGYANRQAIGSNSMMDAFQKSNFSPAEHRKRRLPSITPPRNNSA